MIGGWFPKIQLIILLASLLLFDSSISQTVSFCEGIDESGQPHKTSLKWTVRPDGGIVSIHYMQDSIIRHEKLYVYIDKKEKDVFREFDSRSLIIEEIKKWAVLDYDFNEPGEFRVTFLDQQRKPLAEGSVIIEVATRHITTSYYSGCELFFCEDSRGGEAYNPSGEFAIDEFGGEIVLLIKHTKPLNTNIIIVDIWKKRGEKYDKFVDAVRFRVEPQWRYAKVVCEFSTPGEYKAMIYNEDEIWITSGIVEVVRE